MLALLGLAAGYASREAASFRADIDGGLGALREELRSLAAASSARALELQGRIDGLGLKLDTSYASFTRRFSSLAEQIARARVEAETRASRGTGNDVPDAIAATRDGELYRRSLEAEEAYRSGRYADAAEVYEALSALVPAERRYLERHALALYRSNPANTGNYGWIERDLTASLAEGSDDLETLEVLALIRMERQDWLGALACCEKIAEARPDDVRSLALAGECALLAKDIGRASAFLESADASAASSPEIEGLRSRLESLSPPDRAEAR